MKNARGVLEKLIRIGQIGILEKPLGRLLEPRSRYHTGCPQVIIFTIKMVNNKYHTIKYT